MNDAWHKKLAKFNDVFSDKSLRGFTLMMAVNDYEQDIRSENVTYDELPSTSEALTKQDAEAIIDEYLGKAKELAFWEILILGK